VHQHRHLQAVCARLSAALSLDVALQGMDIYSNILYVKEAFAALSHLAQRAALTNKYRPETACIIGNYYSLKGQHEKVCTTLHTPSLIYTAGKTQERLFELRLLCTFGEQSSWTRHACQLGH